MHCRSTRDALPPNQAGTAAVLPLSGERRLTLPAAARTLPSRGNGSTNPSTIWRWCRKGIRVPGGGRVRLECMQQGGTTFTSREALQRFFDRLQAARLGEVESISARTDRQRERAARASGQRLEAIGI